MGEMGRFCGLRVGWNERGEQTDEKEEIREWVGHGG